MYSLIYFYIAIIVLCWTLNPFIKKAVMKKIDANEYLLINHSIITILLLFYFVYLLKKKKCDVNCIKSLSKNDLALVFLGGVTTVLSTLMLLYLVQSSEVSYVMSHVQPIVILLSFILGYFIFKESLTIQKGIGGILIIAGLLAFNYKKK